MGSPKKDMHAFVKYYRKRKFNTMCGITRKVYNEKDQEEIGVKLLISKLQYL